MSTKNGKWRPPPPPTGGPNKKRAAAESRIMRNVPAFGSAYDGKYRTARVARFHARVLTPAARRRAKAHRRMVRDGRRANR